MRKTLSACVLLLTITVLSFGSDQRPRPDYRVARLPDPTSELSDSPSAVSPVRHNPLRARPKAAIVSASPTVSNSEFRSQVQHVAAQPVGADVLGSARLVDPIVPSYNETPEVSNVSAPVGTSEQIPFGHSAGMKSTPAKTSLLQTIAERPLLAQRKTRHRLDLDQLLATTIKNNSSVRATDYRILKRTQWPSQGIEPFRWTAYQTTDAPVSDATFRVGLNYSLETSAPFGDTSGKIPNVNRILRVDIASPDQVHVESLFQQLDSVVTHYWQLVAERGKLVAATDQLGFYENVLAKLGLQGEAVAGKSFDDTHAAYERCVEKRNEALRQTEAAQQRLVELIGAGELFGYVELLPADLPRGLRLETEKQALDLAFANRLDAQLSPQRVTMDVKVSHKQLVLASQQANRLLKKIAELAEQANQPTSDPNNHLAGIIAAQTQLLDTQSQFLDALVEQQRALVQMKRAQGTLIRAQGLKTQVRPQGNQTQALQTQAVQPPGYQTPGTQTAGSKPEASPSTKRTSARFRWLPSFAR